jgi:rhamnosyltransferase
MLPKVSILLRNLNESQNLIKLFNILNKQTYDNFEVVFLDSGSTDNSVEIAETFKSNYKISVNHIKKSEFTFGKALNKCIEYSDSPKYVISLSAHCFPTDSNFIKNYVNLFIKSNSDIIFGKQSGYEKSKLSESSHLNTWFGDEYGIRTDNPFTNNGNCGYNIKIFQNFKFDENLTGCEDVDLASKVLENNGRIMYGKGIEVQHYHEENLKTIYYRYLREALALNKIFPYKFKRRQFIFFTIKQTYRDLVFKFKTDSYRSRSLMNIFLYRLVKNYAHLKGFKESKVSLNKIYNYTEDGIYSKNLYKHYLH